MTLFLDPFPEGDRWIIDGFFMAVCSADTTEPSELLQTVRETAEARLNNGRATREESKVLRRLLDRLDSTAAGAYAASIIHRTQLLLAEYAEQCRQFPARPGQLATIYTLDPTVPAPTNRYEARELIARLRGAKCQP